jgi:DNA-binding transcriptional ArsR family regulator
MPPSSGPTVTEPKFVENESLDVLGIAFLKRWNPIHSPCNKLQPYIAVVNNVDNAGAKSMAEVGPLTSLFGDPHGRAIAKVLDQSVLVGNMEQTVRMLADSTELDYKTVQSSLRRLEGLGLVKKGRKVGNAQTYRFNVENHLHDLVNFARRMQLTPRRR